MDLLPSLLRSFDQLSFERNGADMSAMKRGQRCEVVFQRSLEANPIKISVDRDVHLE